MNRQMSNAEYELGRYKKKVREQTEELRSLHRQVDDSLEGVREIKKVFDAALRSLVMQYGETVRDEESNEIIGYRIKVSYPFVLDEKWTVQCRKLPEADELIIGLVKNTEE